jgi:hypothetical protein
MLWHPFWSRSRSQVTKKHRVAAPTPQHLKKQTKLLVQTTDIVEICRSAFQHDSHYLHTSKMFWV